MLRVRIITYNDRVIIKGLFSPSEIPILEEEFQLENIKSEFNKNRSAESEEFSHVFSYAAKTERGTIN
ncbi:MAG: hypothetical protein AMJ70_06295 [Dehalococcoidia bacterium SG8_51_3]|nr:MAG: hypothetical protein AMJ70_06295 [Dehalococcoidia bacterium SG8_51_3]